MIKRLRSLLLLLILIGLLMNSAPALSNQYSVYLAATRSLLFPGSIRVGYNNWEVGLISHLSLGFDKILRFDKNYYTALGFIASFASELSPGAYAAIGFDYELGAGLGLRGEFNSTIAINGFAKGDGYFGISYKF